MGGGRGAAHYTRTPGDRLTQGTHSVVGVGGWMPRSVHVTECAHRPEGQRQPGVPTRRLGFGLASKSDLVREQPIHRSGAGGAAGAPENKVRV